jgi:CubicO group peptidase (beta-lactamase class C family)
MRTSKSGEFNMSTKKILLVTLGLATASCASNVVEYPQSAPPAVSNASLATLWSEIPAEMAEYKLPGLSVAVIDNYRITELKTFGVKSAQTQQPIQKTTAYSTASMSKPVTAVICLILAEKGLIDIDAPIAPYLKRWTLPKSEYPGTANVTWRQLLSHTAGTSQHGFSDYYQGDNLPTLVDSLEGRIPRYHKPIEFLFPPGSDWRYSGGGYTIIQVALEDQTGETLPELAVKYVFEPLGMTHTTMFQPGSPEFPTDVALVHDGEGNVIRSGIPITPQIAPSGMWSTPNDLAKLVIAIQRALGGNPDSVISPAAARTLTDIISLKYVGGMGTPFFRGFGLGNTDWFRHDGSNTGVNGDLFGSMDGGYGMVMLGNGDDDNAGPVFATIRREIIEGLGWGARHELESMPIEPDLKLAVIGSYKGLLYNLGLEYQIMEENGKLWIVSEFFTQFLGRDRSELTYLGSNEFAVSDYPNRLRFERDANGAVKAVILLREASKVTEWKRPISEFRE